MQVIEELLLASHSLASSLLVKVIIYVYSTEKENHCNLLEKKEQ